MRPISLLPPERWLRERPWGRDLRHLARGETERLPATFRAIMAARAARVGSPPDDILRETDPVSVLVHLTEKRGEDGRLSADTFMEATTTARVLKEWLDAGSEAFGFTRPLTDELEHTDVDGVMCDDLQFPYRCFYMAFDRQDATDEEPHGFLVIVDGERRLELLPMWDAGHGVDGSKPFTLNLERGRGLAECLDDALGDDGNIADNLDQVRTMMADRNPDDLELALAQITRRADQHGWISRHLALIANGLLYIDQCQSEIRRGWQPGAPADVVDVANSTRPGARKADQRLRAAGWTTIRVCDIDNDGHRRATEGDASRTIATHWRRGHWRRQRHGPGNEYVKLIRIRPTRIGGGPARDPRSYRVDRSAPTTT